MVRWPVRKLARVGRPRSRSASSARNSARASVVTGAAPTSLGDDVAEEPVELGPLPRVAVGGRGQGVGGRGDRLGPRGDRLRPGQRPDRGVEPVDELGEPAGEVDVAAVDVVERQDAADQPEVVLGHRHAEQEPVEARPPRVRVEGRRAGTAPGGRRRGPSGCRSP